MMKSGRLLLLALLFSLNTSAEKFDVSSWLIATTNSQENWTFESAEWTDPGFGNYVNGTASVVSPFLERWTDTAWGTLPDNAMSQTLKNLPAGNYTLAADIIAVRQGAYSWVHVSEETGRGVTLFAGDQQTEAGTRNEKPQHYTVNFTIGKSGTTTLGVRIKQTNANWVAVDNLALYFLGTEEVLMSSEKEKVLSELLGYYSKAEAEKMIDACGNDFMALEKLRHTMDMMPKADQLAQGARNICIDGNPMTYAQSLSLSIATINENLFGKDYSAVITYEKQEGWGDLMINETVVTSGSVYRFEQIEAGKNYTFSIKKTDDTTTLTQDITFTALPVVRLNGTFGNEYSDGYIQVVESVYGTPAELLHMKAKWRGGITNGNGKHKRNYHVKLKDVDGNKLDRRFIGMRNDNSWILEACQVDMSRIRNRVLTDLWNDYSTPPYYIVKEQNAKTGTRGKFVELILNDQYRGIYCLTENIDRKQMKLMKYDEETSTTHGQLWKAKDWSYAVFMGHNRDNNSYPATSPIKYNNKSNMWDSYQVKYPDFEEYGNQTDWKVLYDAVNFVCTSNDADFKTSISEYFDLPLVIDYYILMETILATDNHGKNMFFAVYDKQADKQITFGIWDMDATCGQRWSDDYYHWKGMQPEQDYALYITRQEHGDYNLFRRLRMTDADDFNMKVRRRYKELRASHLATDSILERFKTYLERFKICGAAQREYDKWSGDSDISGLKLDFDDEMDYLTDWFSRRMNYLDKTRFQIDQLPPTGIRNIEQTRSRPATAIYNLAGQQISEDSSEQKLQSLPSGIYIVNGQKIVVQTGK